jgi:hypothetical protein
MCIHVVCVFWTLFSRGMSSSNWDSGNMNISWTLWFDLIGLGWLFRVNKVEFLPFDVNWTWKPNNPNDKPMYSFNINPYLHWSISS